MSLIQKFTPYRVIYSRLYKHDRMAEANILIIQNTALGDAAILVKFLLAHDLCEYRLFVLCSMGLQPLWQRFFPLAQVHSIPEVDDVVIPFGDIHFRYVFCASMNRKAALVAARYHSVEKIGISERHLPKLSELVYTLRIHVHPDLHVNQRYTELVRSIHLPHSNEYCEPPSSASDGYVLLHPGGKWKPRRWHKESFAALTAKLISSGQNVKILINTSETDLIQFFSEVKLQPNILLTQNLNDLMQATAECSIFIGNDSGPMHLANLMGKPTICIWGPGNLQRIRPMGKRVEVLVKEVSCRPCRQYQNSELCPNGDNICLRQIDVEEVYSAFCRIINLPIQGDI